MFSTCARLLVPSLFASAHAGLFDIDIPSHAQGNWRGKSNYLIDHEYISPGHNASSAVLNSCGAAVPSHLMCSGRGRCIHWNDNADRAMPQSRLTFCQCDTYWADPECRTERKSQVTAFLLSLFFGLIGADQFYLGYVATGALKLVTLGGCGVWYLYDLVRIGSCAVFTAQDYRVAADLPHWAYVISIVSLMCCLGFAVSVRSIAWRRVHKAKEVLILKAEHAASIRSIEQGPPVAMSPIIGAESTGPVYRGYGTTMQ